VLALLALVGLALVLKLRLDHAVDVHWDEFNYLAQIYTHERGELRRVLMTLHVHAFGWLRQVSGNEVDQVIAARDAMFALRLASSLCLFLIGRRLMGATGAAFAVFCSLSFSHLLKHGESFRFDPILSFLFLLACSLLILRPGRVSAGVSAGISLAIAALVSLKLVLLLPSVALIFAVGFASGADRASDRGAGRASQRRALMRQLVGLGGGFAVAFGVLYAAHAATLAPAATSDVEFARGAASGYLVFQRFFPGIIDLARSLRWDVGFWPLLAVGAVLALGDAFRRDAERRSAALLMLALALPLTTLIFYKNAFAYFYVCIIPPASLLCGLVAARLAARAAQRPLLATLLVALLALPLAVQLVRFYAYNARDTLARQRVLVDTVRGVFPEPVPYIDRCNMIGSYPGVGPFMITWAMREYRERGRPIMAERLRESQPVFLLANITSLDLRRDWEQLDDHPQRLLREDFELLKRHFIRHWGPLWVAGKRFAELDGDPKHFEILIGGVYTLEASGPMILDGELARPGSVLRLDPGPHRIRSAEGAGRAMLRYGEGLRRPRRKQLEGTYFSGLGFRTVP
jgi:hypothetical protein